MRKQKKTSKLEIIPLGQEVIPSIVSLSDRIPLNYSEKKNWQELKQKEPK